MPVFGNMLPFAERSEDGQLIWQCIERLHRLSRHPQVVFTRHAQVVAVVGEAWAEANFAALPLHLVFQLGMARDHFDVMRRRCVPMP